ncbi:protein of unknown function [Burkholderia multivorans]
MQILPVLQRHPIRAAAMHARHRSAHQYLDRILERLSLLVEIGRCCRRLLDERCIHLRDLSQLLHRELRLPDLETLPGTCLSDCRDGSRKFRHGLLDLAHVRPGARGRLRARRHHVERTLDQRLDFLGGNLCPFRQRAHLAGHDGKPATVLARPGRLDRRVQGEEVRLHGDAIDGAGNFGNAPRVAGEIIHEARRSPHRVRRGRCRLGGAAPFGVGEFRRFGIVFGRVGDLAQCRARLLDRTRLLLRARRQIGIPERQPRGRIAHAVDRSARVHQHAGQLAVHLVEEAPEKPHLRIAALPEPMLQFAGENDERAVVQLGERREEIARHVCRHDRAARRGHDRKRPSEPYPGRLPEKSGRHAGRHQQDHECLDSQDRVEASYCGKREQPLRNAENALADRAPSLESPPGPSPTTQILVQPRGRRDVVGARTRAHGDVSGDLAFAHDRRNVGEHPVEPAVLAPVLDDTRPRIAALDRGPQILEGRLGHVGMAHDILRLAKDLVTRKSAAAKEGGIRIFDHAVAVGPGDDDFILWQQVFVIRDWKIDTHLIVYLADLNSPPQRGGGIYPDVAASRPAQWRTDRRRERKYARAETPYKFARLIRINGSARIALRPSERPFPICAKTLSASRNGVHDIGFHRLTYRTIACNQRISGGCSTRRCRRRFSRSMS